MHPDLEVILAVRDGEADPEAARHVASCTACYAELDRVRAVRDALRALPASAPPGDLWGTTRRRIEAGRRTPIRWLAAAAACLMLAAGGGALLWNLSGGEGVQGPVGPGLQAGADPRGTGPEAPDAGPAPGTDPEVARLIHSSHQLESLLDRMEERPGVVSGREALAEMGLQNRLAHLDARLGTSPPGPATREEQVGLWKERVQLLGTLAHVKGAKRRTVEI